ncbi:hypothetical protein RN04_14525 [Arthrobacter sp. W1]|nr:hypothetical protein RN04_14525 [Arthrobacter sp. W1]
MASRNNPVSESHAAVQKAALVIGIVFFLVGVLGFIPSVTTNYDSLGGAEHHTGAMLLGIFQVSYLHNAVHLLFGIAGLAMSRTVAASRCYLVGGGIIYLALWVYGLVIDLDSSANFIPLNDADNWLHLGLGVGMVALGLLLSRHVAGSNARGPLDA